MQMANGHIIGQYYKWKIESGPNSFFIMPCES